MTTHYITEVPLPHAALTGREAGMKVQKRTGEFRAGKKMVWFHGEDRMALNLTEATTPNLTLSGHIIHDWVPGTSSARIGSEPVTSPTKPGPAAASQGSPLLTM